MTPASRVKSLLLALFATSFLSLSIPFLFFNYAVLALDLRSTLRRRLLRNQAFRSRTILVTGITTPQGLRLARAFHETGHTVVCAESHHRLLPIPSRFSFCIRTFHRLQTPHVTGCTTDDYATEILHVINKNNVTLWIDCSSKTPSKALAQTKHIVEQRSACACFLAPQDLNASFSDADTFLTLVSGHGLPAPDTRLVQSRDDIHKILNDSRGRRKYVLNGPGTASTPYSKTLLPRRTLSQTYNDISKIKIPTHTKLRLEQYVEELERYTTFSVIVRGELKAFVASPITSPPSLQALQASSALNKALLKYVKIFCQKMGQEYTGNLCIDFCVDEVATEKGVEKTILPTDGRSGVEAPMLLFQGLDGSLDLVRSYLPILSSAVNGTPKHAGTPDLDLEHEVATPSRSDRGIYSFGSDIFNLLLSPAMQTVALRMRPMEFFRNGLMLLNHLAYWQESVYDFRDPLPFFWLYQVYLPVMLVLSFFKNDTTSTMSNTRLMIR